MSDWRRTHETSLRKAQALRGLLPGEPPKGVKVPGERPGRAEAQALARERFAAQAPSEPVHDLWADIDSLTSIDPTRLSSKADWLAPDPAPPAPSTWAECRQKFNQKMEEQS